MKAKLALFAVLFFVACSAPVVSEEYEDWIEATVYASRQADTNVVLEFVAGNSAPLIGRLSPYMLGARLDNITLSQNILELYIYVNVDHIEEETWQERLQNPAKNFYISTATVGAIMGALNFYSLDTYWDTVAVDILDIGRLYFYKNDTDPWASSFFGETLYYIDREHINYLVDNMVLAFYQEQLRASLVSSGFVPRYKNIAWAFSDGGFGQNITFYQTPNIIYTTLGSENGLQNTFMYVRGVAQQIIPTEVDLNTAIVRTLQGEILLALPEDLFGFLLEEGFITYPTDLDMLQLDQEFGFFFAYNGFSTLLGMPAGMFVGLN